jgi:hypothetical protein
MSAVFLVKFIPTLVLIVLLAVLAGCTCEPHAEYCGEPFPTAMPRQ